MSTTGIQSNPSTTNHLGAASPASSQSLGSWGKAKAIGHELIQPFYHLPKKWGRYLFSRVFSRVTTPTEALRKIDDVAQKGLQRAKVRGVDQSGQVATRFQGDLDKLLHQRKSAEVAAVEAAAVGPVATIRSIPRDPEVTQAPDLQARVDAPDRWKNEMKANKDILIKLSSTYYAFLEMRDRCGIKVDKERDNLALMNLAKKASDEEAPSIWQLFTSQYKLSFFQKIKAAWFYWVYYKTSLIKNIAETILGSFIKTLTTNLIDKTSNARTEVFHKLLENANQFLIGDIQATERFAAGKGHGDVERYRNEEIERHYDFSLPGLCQKFTEKWIHPDMEPVPIFSSLHDIPILGLLFKGLQWFVNRFIIQRAVKAALPKALEEIVKKGLKATEPHNLPFSLHITRFLTSRLEKVRAELEHGGGSEPTKILVRTELLSPVVKNLMKVLELEKHSTSSELKKKLKEIESDNEWFSVKEEIEDGIVDAGNLLCKIFNETAQSGELVAQLEDLAIEVFSKEHRDPELLAAQYQEELLKFERVAGEVAEKIIHTAIKKRNGDKSENAKKGEKDSLEARQTVANKTMDELTELCKRMTEKINQSASSPASEQHNVQTDLTAFFQIMQVFANRKEMQDGLQSLGVADQDAIWRIVTPLYQRAARIQERVLHLQELQDHYPSHATVEKELNLIKDLLKSIRNQLHTQPRHLQNPLIQSLKKSAEEIAKCLGVRAPLSVHLEGFIKQLADLSESIANQQKKIDALHALYPPRLDGAAVAQEGFLGQLLHFKQGIPPRGFNLKTCFAEIRKYLAYFPPAERQELEALIGDSSNLIPNEAQLRTGLQRIYQKYMALKTRDTNLLELELDTASTWTQDKTSKYGRLKEQDHADMQTEMREISTEVAALRNDTFDARLNLPASLTPLASKVQDALLGAGLTGILGWAGSFLGPLGTAVGTGLGAVAGAAAYPVTQNFGRLLNGNKEAFISTLLGTGLMGAASYFVPGGAHLGVAVAAWNRKEAAHAFGKDYVHPKVRNIFINAYRLSLSPRVYKAATTRALNALSE